MNQPYTLGTWIPENGGHYTLLSWVLRTYQPQGLALEFGVGSGESTAIITEHLPCMGFDSFAGLPEDWRDGFPQGMFAPDTPGEPPVVDDAVFMIGLYQDTWQVMRAAMRPNPPGLIHIDCDLYSSTKTVLDAIGLHLRAPTIVVFDEWHGYEGCERYEQRAWREFASANPVRWEVLGHSFQQWAVRIT